ncbi:unnamed protein product [Cuscuta europaea]|uniref:Uncharacterized protein n=1 Tax=Cuscuta europaea TaxID=41803 RepID=A0A9P0ZXN2_CUSEU|nr:unnamed protein product [Cuscuta europaea]
MFWRERERENKEQNGGPPCGQVRVIVVGDSALSELVGLFPFLQSRNIKRSLPPPFSQRGYTEAFRFFSSMTSHLSCSQSSALLVLNQNIWFTRTTKKSSSCCRTVQHLVQPVQRNMFDTR